MERFFQPTPDPTCMAEVRKILGCGDTAAIGPVHTNYPAKDSKRPRLVIVCESPSYAEVFAGFPTVCSTGKRICGHLSDACMISLPEPLSAKNYLYHTHYRHFRRSGIYLTNLVRYQTDFDAKGTTGVKDSNVRRIWHLTKGELFGELDQIKTDFGTVPVLLAIGGAFYPQLKEIVVKLQLLGMPWFITDHPSRSSNESSAHYNPMNWDNEQMDVCDSMSKMREWLRKKERPGH